MYLDLRYHAGGMRTYNKHSFSFQACVNMKLNLSKVLHGSSLCKNEPMYLDLRYHAGGMRTYNKHSFSFQACVNMKLNLSKVLHGSSLCKNEPIPDLHLVIPIFIR